MISYLITDPKYYTSDETKFACILQNSFQSKQVDFACFRDKQSTNTKNLSQIFVSLCNDYGVKSFINTDYILARDLQSYGVHLTSTQFCDIKKAKDMGLYVIISTHNDNDINQAIKNSADMITYSPIFDTPDKGTAKGIEELNRVCNSYHIPIIALGGIVSKLHIDQISTTPAKGFASIRYFV